MPPNVLAGRRVLVAAAFAVLALLRLATLAPDPWEWDEVLFVEGVREGLDVRVSHPHAPGYPVFIRLGQAIHALGVEPFRAATLAGALGAYLSVLALYLLLRELGTRRKWALAGALLYGLTPSVWLHGVRPLSDGPGAAAALFASVFLVRAIAGKGRRSLLWAAIFTALAAGVRPQVGLALLPAAAVAAALVFRRGRRTAPVLLAALAALAVTLAIWIPVFRGSGGFVEWKQRLDAQMQYVTRFDSPKARDLARLAFWKRWWADPVGSSKVAAAFLALGLAGAVAERRKAGLILLLFVPVTALTLGVLSTDSAPRYAVAFWASPCALAAFALDRASPRRVGRVAAPAAAVLFLGSFAVLGAPGILEVATRKSPSVAVMEALRAEGRSSRDVFVTEPLRVHAREFLGGASVVDEAVPMRIPADAVFVGADDRPFGVVPQRTFTFETPRLARISRGRYLRTEVFEGRSGAGVYAPTVTRPGSQMRGRVELPEGTTLSVGAAGPADVSFTGTAAGDPAEIEMKTSAGILYAEVAADRERALSFAAVPDRSDLLFTISCRRGRAVLDGFLIRARGSGPSPALRLDDGIPASIDEPAEGARVASPFRASGWCQERGGGRVDAVEFRLDGFLLEGTRVARTPRPDVAAVLPAIGDASAAGWEAVLSPKAAPGRHTLTVTFQAGDRRRIYPPRTIEIVAAGKAR